MEKPHATITYKTANGNRISVEVSTPVKKLLEQSDRCRWQNLNLRPSGYERHIFEFYDLFLVENVIDSTLYRLKKPLYYKSNIVIYSCKGKKLFC